MHILNVSRLRRRPCHHVALVRLNRLSISHRRGQIDEFRCQRRATPDARCRYSKSVSVAGRGAGRGLGVMAEAERRQSGDGC